MLTAVAAILFASQSFTVEARFPICGEGPRVTCVVDGDTFWLDRVKYRLADIDSPEVSQPRCNAEARLAQASTLRLTRLLNAGMFQLETRGTDRYGRTLVVVSRSGYSLGALLVSEGLAREWGDRTGWC